MTQFIVSFRGLDLSDDQVVRVKSGLERAMKHEYESLSATTDVGAQSSDTSHEGRSGFPAVFPVSYQPRAL
jgi:hypothetical protein